MSGAIREEGAALPTPIRVVTAAALFDGHDAAIHIMRRLLQAKGAEVIHLRIAVPEELESQVGLAVSIFAHFRVRSL